MLASVAEINNVHDVKGYILSIGCKRGSYSDCLQRNGYTIFYLDSSSPLLFFKLIVFFIYHRFDVIHIHTEKNFILYFLISRAFNKKIIRTYHAVFDVWGRIYGLRRKAFLKFASRLGLIGISISRTVKNNEKSLYNNETIVISNWINSELYNYKSSRKSPVENNKKIKIISVGNCDRNKNHDIILQTLKLVQIRHEDIFSRIEYVHIGEGSETSNEVENAKSLGIDSAIKWISSQNPLEELIKSDIFICSSKKEGFSLATLEAYYLGLQVVVSKIAIFEKFEKEGLDLKLFDLSQEEALYNQLISLFNGKIEKVNRENHKYSLKNYLEYVKLYKSGSQGIEN